MLTLITNTACVLWYKIARSHLLHPSQMRKNRTSACWITNAMMSPLRLAHITEGYIIETIKPNSNVEITLN